MATTTAIALIVDGARMPVYLAIERDGVLSAWHVLIASIVGVLLGTFLGVRVLRRIPERTFRTFLHLLILALGIYMLIHGFTIRNGA